MNQQSLEPQAVPASCRTSSPSRAMQGYLKLLLCSLAEGMVCLQETPVLGVPVAIQLSQSGLSRKVPTTIILIRQSL